MAATAALAQDSSQQYYAQDAMSSMYAQIRDDTDIGMGLGDFEFGNEIEKPVKKFADSRGEEPNTASRNRCDCGTATVSSPKQKKERKQQTQNNDGGLNIPHCLWDSSISTPSEARTWLATHLTEFDTVRPENDDVANESSSFVSHAKNLFDALLKEPAPGPATANWTPDIAIYFKQYQATGMAILTDRIKSIDEVRGAQSQCLLVIEMVFTSHGPGIARGTTKTPLDASSKASERIQHIIAFADIKRIAIDIIDGKSDTMRSLVRNPRKLLASRIQSAKNNKGKRDRNSAGSESLDSHMTKGKLRTGTPRSSLELVAAISSPFSLRRYRRMQHRGAHLFHQTRCTSGLFLVLAVFGKIMSDMGP